MDRGGDFKVVHPPPNGVKQNKTSLEQGNENDDDLSNWCSEADRKIIANVLNTLNGVHSYKKDWIDERQTVAAKSNYKQ